VSGIAGIVRLDGAPVAPDAIERMANAIVHRGGDGGGVWSNREPVGGRQSAVGSRTVHGSRPLPTASEADWRLPTVASTAFAHATLHTTPESRDEEQPFVELTLTIVADVRLDNREELLSLLDIRASIGNAALILAAYRKWGNACASRLEGDFAFAIWNERERTLFCARDPFGVKPFVYALLPGKLFAFGSEARALLTLDEIPRDVDEKRIADFLALYFDDVERTFYHSLRRLPGGCTLTLDVNAGKGTIAVDRYWSPEQVPELRLRGADRDAQYAAGFREHFVRAVRERMRAVRATEIGAMLSGGLDSTSIACVARDDLRASGAGPLPVFSWIFSDSMDADEREYQQAVIAAGGMRPITLDSAQLDASPWTDIDALLPDGPPYAPNHYLNSMAARQARDIGVRVLLDGTGGDSTISRGRARFVELFVRGRPVTLARELRAMAARRGTNESLPRLFLGNVAAPLMPPSLLAFALRLRGRASTGDPARKLLTPRMAQLTGAASARHRWTFSAQQEHVAQLTSPMLADGLELLDRTMAMHGVEGRYPFFDRRLAEYCLSLPADQKLADGYSRIVARRAMAGIVPDVVRWRAGKGLPGVHVIPALRRSRAILDDLFVRDPSVLAPYLDIDVLRTLYADFLSERPTEFRTAIRLWSAAVLARWLRR
jgi:asparagine synthase (glutamine-hydrolysing)